MDQVQMVGKRRPALLAGQAEGQKRGWRAAGPKPTSRRPSVSKSSTAASSATRSGFSIGKVIIAVPRRIRSVCAATWARNTSGEGRPPSCS
nr:Uncharacterised protein [Klebsiella pneumoniae]